MTAPGRHPGEERLTTPAGLPLVVAPAGPRDEEDVYAALNAVFAAGEGFPQGAPVDRAEFRAYWIDHSAAVTVARDPGGALVGSYYLKANFPGRAAHIANAGYFVVAEFRGRGAGRALVEHSLGLARALGFDAMVFNLVFEGNPARALYESLGFEAVGRVPDAVDGEPAVVYWRRL